VPLRRVVRVVAVVAAVAIGATLTLAGCGRSGLDEQQQATEARACASLVERHVAKVGGNGSQTLDGQQLDLDRPTEFYRLLRQLRPPSIFRLDDARTFRYARSSLLSDLCKDKGVAPGVTTTTTTTTSTTTTTTVPGSGG
jgi:hypothetical protein